MFSKGGVLVAGRGTQGGVFSDRVNKRIPPELFYAEISRQEKSQEEVSITAPNASVLNSSQVPTQFVA